LELNKAGFLETIIKGGQQREQWMKELLLAARRCVMHSLQEIDLANFLTSGTGEHITSALKLAQPPKLAKAKCQTLLALSATSQSLDQVKKIAKEVMTQIGTTPALAVQEAADFTIVCESSGLPIGEVAQRLIDFRSDLGEYAQRIYSRNDIPFQTLSWEPGRTE